ncbi:helix-turn-helix domain-containing protein [Nitratireductor aquibiodomus]|uniref:helix-turn-helix domain-containing protein n=1 Tax=Nitratireductor aquibiodomus TaxID=204799 RepID=UPI000B878AFD|nr:helix-turn-helix transcriptional regulator [Nitratireductor aquibiodomus]
MHGKIPEIVRKVESKRRETLMSQAELSSLLKVHQGHLSKVLTGKAPVSTKMRLKMSSLLSAWPPSASSDPALEQELLTAMRRSTEFQEFIRAALKMHKS